MPSVARAAMQLAFASVLVGVVNATPVVVQPSKPEGLQFGSSAAAELRHFDPIPPEIQATFGGKVSPALRQRGLDLKRRLDARPNDPYLMHALATVLYHEGRIKEANALWLSSSKREPNLASAELMAALQALFAGLATGKADDAKTRLATIEKRYALDPHFQLVLAEQAMQGGNLAVAEAAYRKAHELGPKLWVTSLNLARFLDHARNDTAAALRLCLDAATLAPQRPEPLNRLAVLQVKQNQSDAALESLRKVKALDAQSPMPERRMAELTAALGRYDDARRWYLAALDKRPPKDDTLALRVGLGDVLMRLNRPAEARSEMEAVLKEQWLAPLVFALGTLDEAEGRPVAAEQRYRQILKKAPGHPLAANNLAMLLIKAGREAPQALSLAQQARRALPGNAIVEGTWACAMVENRRANEAVDTLRSVANAQGDGDAWTQFCLGKALMSLHREAEAAPHLHKAMAIDSRFARRDELARLLKSAR